jgi:glycosyltransferase involved in cell wall biosynthesis
MTEAPGAPLVSVLVKAFNHAPYIRQTIDSILQQSLQDFEIVVTDDASTDGTRAILHSYTDHRIRLQTSTRNLGISGAMNATIARARGRYCAILNSDDWALAGRLQRQVDFLEANPAVSLVFGLPVPVGEDGAPAEAFYDFTHPLRLPDFSRRSWLRQFFFIGNCLCAPTAMIRRKAYQAAGAYDRRLTNLQDLDMWIRMLIAGHAIHVLPEPVTAFRVRANHANMSAPRPDTRLRTKFETGRVLRHFAAFDAMLFDEVFGDANRHTSALAAATAPGAPAPGSPALRVAALALQDPRLEYQSFALDVLHATAQHDDDFDRLRTLTGCVDAYGSRTILELCQTLTKQQAAISRLTETVAAPNRQLADAADASARPAEARPWHVRPSQNPDGI